MKTKYILITLFVLCTTTCFAQNKLFDKYVDMDGVTSVYISKAMFRMMPVVETAGLNLMNMKGKVESLQLVTAEKKSLCEQMRSEFTKLISSKHAELMRVKSESTRTTFYADMDGDRVKELIMLADTEDGFTAVLLTGNFTIQDIQEITKETKTK